MPLVHMSEDESSYEESDGRDYRDHIYPCNPVRHFVDIAFCHDPTKTGPIDVPLRRLRTSA